MNRFYTNYTDVRFIDKLKKNLDDCQSFCFSVSFIKKAGLKLIIPNIDAALARGAKGRLITTTYQNFTDIDSLEYFFSLKTKYPDQFDCHLDKDCFIDKSGNKVGFHSKGYLFKFYDHNELLVGSSNITVYALLKNVEWDVSLIDDDIYSQAMTEFDYLWDKTHSLSRDLIAEYRTRLFYAIERWDMDYDVANADTKPNYMQRTALKELNRIRAMGNTKALVCAAAGSGKTFLAAFDARNFNPDRLLYIVQEGSILMKSYETFSKVFGADKTYGIYNKDFKEINADFLFSTNITMANSLELFDRRHFDYIIIDECHHATAETYKKIIEYFEPQFLLGITATPERMDGEDVFGLFDQNIPYELRLRDAIVNGLVVPFKYYGIRDEFIEYGIAATKGHKFVEQFSDEKHCDFIYNMIEKHRLPGGKKLKALAFCRDVSHAIRMSQAMGEYYNTRYLTGKNTVGERVRAYKELQDDDDDLEILFTVDILNEGVDIPGVNMVLFLRPTDSQTIFIQQLGRGLRKYENKDFVTVLDFIGNDYKRSVQIAFALGGLSENFVVEKKLISALVKDDFRSIGLMDYGVEIHIDDLSKKDIICFIDEVNFNTKKYLEQDYLNFKKYIGSEEYPRHVDYLNNDYAPDIMKFMQSRIHGVKSKSYYSFLKAIDEKNIPSFDERQEAFIDYVSDMLPIVRPDEYLIIEKLLDNVGECRVDELEEYVKNSVEHYSPAMFKHALKYMHKKGHVLCSDRIVRFNDINITVEFDEYLRDLINYGIGRYDVEFYEINNSTERLFKLWAKFKKRQIKELLQKDPDDIQLGTNVYDGVAYAYVTIHKASSTKENLKYVDGYIDSRTFQWETVAHITDKELSSLKNSSEMHLFVRKTDSEDGIQLPFTYIGSGKMEYIEGSKKPNGAHLFNIRLTEEAPEDIYYDFKLPG
ncbi:PLD-like domain-containing protein [Oscillospiraceae bacterium]|nr:PLD-like domain-containing protein [Oscillospiraceae bacterium]